MKRAFYVEILNYGCKDGLLEATQFTGPMNNDIYVYNPPTNESWGAVTQDPYERKNVIMSPSTVPNRGASIFYVQRSWIVGTLITKILAIPKFIKNSKYLYYRDFY